MPTKIDATIAQIEGLGADYTGSMECPDCNGHTYIRTAEADFDAREPCERCRASGSVPVFTAYELVKFVNAYKRRGEALAHYAIGVDPMSYHGELMQCELCGSNWNNGQKRNEPATPENHKPDCLLFGHQAALQEDERNG